MKPVLHVFHFIWKAGALPDEWSGNTLLYFGGLLSVEPKRLLCHRKRDWPPNVALAAESV